MKIGRKQTFNYEKIILKLIYWFSVLFVLILVVKDSGDKFDNEEDEEKEERGVVVDVEEDDDDACSSLSSFWMASLLLSSFSLKLMYRPFPLIEFLILRNILFTFKGESSNLFCIAPYFYTTISLEYKKKISNTLFYF